MNFRYDIGALRAIAVLAVVLFHFQIPFFRGGFVGVDIFFVISGYLMTAIILKGFRQQDFSFIKFYSRRAQRIIPALAFLLVSLSAVSLFTLLPKDIKTINEYALSSLFFVSNISYYLNSGYFDNTSQSNFLLHTWSLSVEWQFYMIYPLLLYPCRKIINSRPQAITVILLALALLSFVAMYLVRDNSSLAFYMFPPRAWEMICGGLILSIERKFKGSRRVRQILSGLGFVTLFYCIYIFNEKDISWPSQYTLIPVLATSMIIFANADFEIYKNRILQFIGKISYSWYLWHWPIFVLAFYFALSGYTVSFALIAVSIILATLSYYFIERNQQLSSIRGLIISSSACLILSLGLLFIKNHTDKSDIYRLSNYNENYRKEYLQKQFRTGVCHIDMDNTFEQYDKKGCLYLHPLKKNILLIGDSHAGALSLSFKKNLQAQGMNLLQATVSTSYPLLNTKGPKNSVKLMDYIYKSFIPQHASTIYKVYITGFWGSGQYDAETTKSKIQELVQYLEKYKIDYTIIGQTPAYTLTYPEILALEKKLNTHLEGKYILKQAEAYNSYFTQHLSEDEYFDVWNFPFIKYQEGQSFMYDDDHLSIFGADQLIQHLVHHTLH